MNMIYCFIGKSVITGLLGGDVRLVFFGVGLIVTSLDDTLSSFVLVFSFVGGSFPCFTGLVLLDSEHISPLPDLLLQLRR